ncbi:transposase zinc-binding domain-containing protein [Desulfobulbus rhabdoformis]|nr:transposase zinc-binding domain-containing protein [Desulfobulbus rhabdoformis]
MQCPDCQHGQGRPLSCGNRHCPRCQNHLTSLWIDKQQEKLLPVPSFMVTFTLPYQLRSLAYRHQKDVYSLMFGCAADVLRSFAHNAKSLGAEIGSGSPALIRDPPSIP